MGFGFDKCSWQIGEFFCLFFSRLVVVCEECVSEGCS